MAHALVAQLGSFHDVARLEAEHRAPVAIAATVCHGLVLDVRLDVEAAAFRAMRAVRPYLFLEPAPGRIIVREHPHQLDQADAFAVALSGGCVDFAGHSMSPIW